MINWMRNHASAAHDSDHRVEKEDVIALGLILQKNLFESDLPDPGHSVNTLFDPIRNSEQDEENLQTLVDQINSLRNQDIRICFGFFLECIREGKNPAFSNVKELFPALWELSNEDLRKTAGVQYHSLTLDPDSDESEDNGAKTRLLELLIDLDGVSYVPDGTRAKLFRRAAENLAKAKDKSYGWSTEEAEAKTLKQLGTSVPSVAFEEVFQEILAVWCGNYWGRSTAHQSLAIFIEQLNTDQLRKVMKMFRENERVTEELFQRKPKSFAKQLLSTFEERFTIESNKEELRETINYIDDL